jgi:predicted ATPase
MHSNALDYITIEGFKSIASIEKLALKPINVVIGANGSGKSNFIGVFDFLHAIQDRKLRDYVSVAGGAEKILHFGSKVTNRISLILFLANGGAYGVQLLAASDDSLSAAVETVEGRDGTAYHRQEPTRWMRDQVASWRIYHVHDTSATSPMRKTSKVDDNRFLRPDGSNLAAFLYFLRVKHQTCYTLIQQTIRRAAPFFDDFQLEPLQLKPDDIKLEWRHKRSDQYFDASSLSDGTLRFMALATLFLQPKEYRPSLILVDEPELGLHPYAIGMLAALIRQASVDTQVIVSTQSSLLLDHFEPEDILVADLVDGGTQLTRLDSSQLAKWLENYSLGQLWEKNELGGRPVPA